MLSTLGSSARSENQGPSEAGDLLSGQDFARLSLHDLKERADRMRATSYTESCKHRTLVPEARALVRQAQETIAATRIEWMRHGVLVAEIKKNSMMSGEIYAAAARPPRRIAKTCDRSVQ